MSLCINPQCPNSQNPDNILFCQACGSELLLQGRYRAIRVLGSGGFGKTYEVKEGTTSKVLKVLINNSPKAVELFQKEAKVLSQLIHPGIPRVESNGYFVLHPANSQQPVHCLVMEKMDGENLREYIRRIGRPIDGELATRWLTELVLILEQVHNQRIWHRDIKPQNIILKPDGKLALIDFGAVREGTGTEVATAASSGGGTEVATHAAGGTSISSTGYTPLEQLNGQAVPQSDFFALGRTFIFLLTAKEPTDKSMYDAFNDEIRWRNYASIVSSQLADLIDHMQARLPSQRPANAQFILQVLQNRNTSSQTSQTSSHRTQFVGEDPGSNSTSNSSSSSQFVPQPPAIKKNKIGAILGGVLGVLALAGVRAVNSPNESPDQINPPWSSCGLVSGGGNVRTVPNGQIIDKVSSRTPLTTTGKRDGDWIEISAPVQGWVHNSRIIDTCTGNSAL